MDKITLAEKIKQRFADQIDNITVKDSVTLEISKDQLLEVCSALRDEKPFCFEQLIDVCGVDYLDYGLSHWRTEETTATGFDRGVTIEGKERANKWKKARYGVIYHLLSVSQNHRVRLKVYVGAEPEVPSVIDIWASANWYEREAFDLFGIIFNGHPDLRRILTDYGFVGHPFRKDFPLIGEVELRYDAVKKRCIYEPVSIQQRVLVPKVIRKDHRYMHTENEEGNPNA